MFKGSMVALVTPMLEDGSIDTTAVQDLVEWHIAEGTSALVIAGTTGESVTLSMEEQFELLTTVIQHAKKRIPIIAGAGTNNTRTTIQLMKNAERAGADACLLVTPYYNKPPQEGLYQHYKMAAEAVCLPIILYNVPGRTCCDLLPETVERLAKINNIIGIKEATGNLERCQEIAKRCGNSFEIYSGDDHTALSLMQEGACGVISVTANVAPKKMAEMCHAALSGNKALALQINQELDLLHRHLFVQANPIPTKWALTKMGKIKPYLRLPLIPLESPHHTTVLAAMKQAGIHFHSPETVRE